MQIAQQHEYEANERWKKYNTARQKQVSPNWTHICICNKLHTFAFTYTHKNTRARENLSSNRVEMWNSNFFWAIYIIGVTLSLSMCSINIKFGVCECMCVCVKWINKIKFDKWKRNCIFGIRSFASAKCYTYMVIKAAFPCCVCLIYVWYCDRIIAIDQDLLSYNEPENKVNSEWNNMQGKQQRGLVWCMKNAGSSREHDKKNKMYTHIVI